jgi:hypothetical protein
LPGSTRQSMRRFTAADRWDNTPNRPVVRMDVRVKPAHDE